MEKLSFQPNPENAVPMAKYMKNHFPFAGVKAPERKLAAKTLLKESRQWDFATLLTEVTEYYARTEREYQYLAIDLVGANVKRLTVNELKSFLPLVGQKQWWDSIDAWRKVFADFVLKNPGELAEVFGWFYGQEDFWLRRIGINLQLKFKEQTDLNLLKQAILADIHTPEFFIQKAIGWSLREYSKTDEAWVTDFLCHHEFSKLVVTEASKYLKK